MTGWRSRTAGRPSPPRVAPPGRAHRSPVTRRRRCPARGGRREREARPSRTSRTSATSSSIFAMTSVARSQSKPTDAARLPYSYARSSPGSVLGTPPSVVFGGGARRRAFLALEVFPAPEHFLGRSRALGVAEHVRMPPDELRRDRVDRVARPRTDRPPRRISARNTTSKSRSPSSSFRSSRIAAIDRVERLVGLLEQEGPQRRERLLAVPRAAVGSREGAA